VPSLTGLIAHALILKTKAEQKESGERFWVNLKQPPCSPTNADKKNAAPQGGVFAFEN